MSQFTKSLEKRIQELTASLDAQKTELAAYQRVLHMELSKGSAPAESAAVAESLSVPSELRVTTREEIGAQAPSAAEPGLPAKANKTTMVAEVVKSYGSEGATPKDVDAYFTAKNVVRSKNLVYNTLSYLVARDKLTRRDGKYFAIAGVPAVTRKKRGPAPAPAKAKSTKRRLSPEGLQRIKDALKKRWAAKKAAEAGSKPPVKRATKKK